MIKDQEIEKYLKIWHESLKEEPSESDHPDGRTLFQMAGPGGIKNARDEQVDHLSFCPACMKKWSLLCTLAEEVGADDYTGDVMFSSGGLKAASGGKLEQIRMDSDCRKFKLSIYPSKDGSTGTAVLDLTSGLSNRYEGMVISVCDAKGAVIIKGPIRAGTIARKIKEIDRLDLKHWSAVLVSVKND